MSFLALTLPLSLLLAGTLVALVVRAAADGGFEDWEGPAWRHFYDDDRTPEVEGDAASGLRGDRTESGEPTAH